VREGGDEEVEDVVDGPVDRLGLLGGRLRKRAPHGTGGRGGEDRAPFDVGEIGDEAVDGAVRLAAECLRVDRVLQRTTPPR
jgi:hypothetical protein